MTFKQKLQSRAKKSIDVKALKKFSPYQIILSPVLTEKTHIAQEKLNKYVFKVHSEANKNDIKKAISYLYNVNPLKVNMIKSKEKYRSQRGLVRRSFKKVIVTLWDKDKIDIGL